MKYLSAYYWNKVLSGLASTSLVLQQMQYEKLGFSMLFGCLCAQDAMAEELLGWIGRKKLKTRQRIGQIMDEWERELERILERWARMTWSVSGILCLGNEFLLFYRGPAQFYIINTRFGRNHVKAVPLSGTQGIIRGCLDSGVGILLPNHNFMNGISEWQLQEILNVQELRVEEQLESRLRELGKLGKKHDIGESERWNEEITVSQGSAAILVVTKERNIGRNYE